MGRIIGIDYSLTCPCICVQEKSNTKFIDSKIHYLTDNKKMTGVFGNIIGHSHMDYNSPEQRYEQITFWTINQMGKISDIERVFIEDYSFGSKGKVFHIAENAGLLKYQMYKLGIKFETIPPTRIKKFVGKGNYSKDQMYDAFLNKTGIDLYKQLGITRGKKVSSPVSDIVDSYFIACYGLEQNNT
jgi:hypothetical protein